MASRLISPPASTPISLAEAKEHLRVDHTDQDAMISALIEAATGHIENVTGRALITQTLETAFDSFPTSEIPLAAVPVQSIESVKYDGTDGLEQTVSGANYDLDARETTAWLYPVGGRWPVALSTYAAVRVAYVAGYGDNAEDVPAPIRHAIKLLVAHWFANAEVVTDKQGLNLPFGVDALIRPYKVFA